MTKIVVILAGNNQTHGDVSHARQRCLYTMSQSYTPVPSRTVSHYELHMCATEADVAEVTVDKDTYCFLYFNGNRKLTTQSLKVMSALVEKLNKVEGGHTDVEILE